MSARTPVAEPARDSSYLLRASVLDAALAIGLVDTSVDDWLSKGEEPKARHVQIHH